MAFTFTTFGDIVNEIGLWIPVVNSLEEQQVRRWTNAGYDRVINSGVWRWDTGSLPPLDLDTDAPAMPLKFRPILFYAAMLYSKQYIEQIGFQTAESQYFEWLRRLADEEARTNLSLDADEFEYKTFEDLQSAVRRRIYPARMPEHVAANVNVMNEQHEIGQWVNAGHREVYDHSDWDWKFDSSNVLIDVNTMVNPTDEPLATEKYRDAIVWAALKRSPTHRFASPGVAAARLKESLSRLRSRERDAGQGNAGAGFFVLPVIYGPKAFDNSGNIGGV